MIVTIVNSFPQLPLRTYLPAAIYNIRYISYTTIISSFTIIIIILYTACVYNGTNSKQFYFSAWPTGERLLYLNVLYMAVEHIIYSNYYKMCIPTYLLYLLQIHVHNIIGIATSYIRIIKLIRYVVNLLHYTNISIPPRVKCN